MGELPRAPRLAWSALAAMLFLAGGLPFAALGIAAFFVPYRLCDVVARRIVPLKEDLDELALYKILVGALAFSATFLLELVLVRLALGWPAALVAMALVPSCGLFALAYLEEARRDGGAARTLVSNLLWRNGSGVPVLRAERDALRAECDRLAALFRRGMDNRST